MKILAKIPPFLRLLAFVEMWERFSFYGLSLLLILFLTHERGFEDHVAYSLYALYMGTTYFGPILGGFLADRVFGYRKMVLIGGIVISLGHFMIGMIAVNFEFMYLGLALVAVGVGMFKGNITNLLSACYQDSENPKERERGFTIFYVGINIGGAFAPVLCSYTGDFLGWGYAFGMAGLWMLTGLIFFVRYQRLLGQHGLPPAAYYTCSRFFQRYAVPLMVAICIAVSFGVAVALKNSTHLSNIKEVLAFITVVVCASILLRVAPKERARVVVIILLAICMMLFFVLEEQLGGMLTLFAKRNVAHEIWGLYISPGSVQGLSPMVIIVFGLLIAPVFARCDLRFSIWRLVLSFVCLTLSFFLLYTSCLGANAQGITRLGYLLVAVALIGVGEVLISPLILSLVPLLAPPRFRGTLMGLVMVSYAFSDLAYYIFAKLISVPKSNGVIDPLQSLGIYQNAFFNIIFYNLIIIVMILLVAKFMHKVITQPALLERDA